MSKWMIVGLAILVLAVFYFVFLRAPDRLADVGRPVPQARAVDTAQSRGEEATVRQVRPEMIVAELDPAQRAEIQNALDHGRKIDAIMMLREAASLDLKDAKTVAEHMQRKQ